MGSDKRLALVAGETLLERAVRRMTEEGFAVTVVGGPRDIPHPATHLPDLDPGTGPMTGVLTALSLPTPLAVVGVDMPDVSAGLLLGLAALDQPIAATPVHDGVVQPLHAVWGPAARETLSAAWDRGERSLRRFLESSEQGVTRMAEKQATILAGGRSWWTSLDTPDDLAGRQSSLD